MSFNKYLRFKKVFKKFIVYLFVIGWRDVTPDAQVSEKGRQLILAQLCMVGDCVSVKSSVLSWVTWRRMKGVWSPRKALDHFSRSSYMILSMESLHG